MIRGLALAGLLIIIAARPALADAGWIESGDTALRNDLLLLNDAGVIRLPVNQWPMPRAAVRYALEHGKLHLALNASVTAALDRVRARFPVARDAQRSLSFDASLTAGQAGLLRDFDALGRDDGELRGRATYSLGERAEASLNVTGVANPEDDHSLRLDGSHATVQLGNWLFSAHALDRWWGPSHESSLILSNNARPMPTFMVERATAQAFESPWLHWLGPWRFSFGISRMENEREDIDAPLFMAWRIVVMPWKDIELGLSRTAQFCGRQLICDVNSFFNMLAGNDNVGIDATPETEPGNQMAGFDIRWTSPLGNLPYAVYSQMIGEDESSYLPAKYLMQLGAEVWKPLRNGALLQAFAEYSSTTCSANSARGPYYNCAYNQGRFDVEGYRYEGRVIGHTSDRDAENYSVGATLTEEDGTLWSATARTAILNRDGLLDVTNTVAQVRTEYNALELGWKGKVFGEQLRADLGVESIEPIGGERDTGVFGFLSWHHEFKP